jgi:hypothetical protein
MKDLNFINDLYFEEYKPGISIESGDVLQMNDGRFPLVGDVNEVLGICDDCWDYRREDVYSITKDVIQQLSKRR